MLGELLDEVSGTIALEGTLGWGAGDGRSRPISQLLLERARLHGRAGPLQQVNGVVEIDRLSPLTTPPGQQLAIGLLDLGLPLTRGLIVFELLPGPHARGRAAALGLRRRHDPRRAVQGRFSGV